ncbi:MAG: HRDC domain-containing protein, partial [bacterium]|nr:HRDC domain-containing protein [bacterium]
ADEMKLYDDELLYNDRDPDVQYQRVKGVGRLTRHELAVVRELAAWRESEGKLRDIPRGRVMSDEAFLEIAKRKPATMAAFQGFRRVTDRDLQRYGEALLAAVQRGIDLKEKDCPVASDQGHPNPAEDARLDLAMAFMRGRSLAEGIDIALVASRSDVKDVVANGESTGNRRLLKGWRLEFLGADLLALLKSGQSIAVDPDTRLPSLIRKRSEM